MIVRPRPGGRRLGMLTILLLLTIGGCSDSGNEAAPATSVGTSVITQPTTTLRPVDTSFSGQGSAAFCDLAKTFNDRFAGFTAPATPAQLRTSLGEGRTALNQATSVAPAEIKADMQILSAAFGELFTALDKTNFNANALDPATLTKLQAPEFVTASQRLQAYLRNVCKTG